MKNKQSTYTRDNLLLLKEIFYSQMEYAGDGCSKINIGLNLFYGNPAEDTEQWKSAFRDGVKKPVGKTKKGDLKLDGFPSKEFKALSVQPIIDATLMKAKDIKKKLVVLYDGTTFNKTVIYEAPPYLLCMDKTSSDFVAEFILDKRCTSPYANAINSCFNAPEKASVVDTLRTNTCGFFDVIPMPLPINSALRNLWATDERYLIDGKRIFVHFFEWAFEKYLEQASVVTTGPHQLAVGIPLNNSITLYEHYESHGPLVFNGINIDFNAPHSIPFSDKKLGLWINPFKNCIIASSNTPTADLMKLAFG
jgi:hypothetical protein